MIKIFATYAKQTTSVVKTQILSSLQKDIMSSTIYRRGNMTYFAVALLQKGCLPHLSPCGLVMDG